MQMINVLQRLAELDAKKATVNEGQVQECGPMGMMDSMPHMGMDKPSVPANFSINASAASGDEVANMMSQILTLAGMKQVGAGDLGAEPQGAIVTAEPTMAVGPMAAEPISGADDMRSVLDKLNPEPEGDEGSELGPFQHDSDDAEDSDSDNSDEEPQFGNEEGEDDDEEKKETDEGQYDNSPADPTEVPQADANQYAHQENQPGTGNTADGKKRQSNLPTATFEALMKEYKQFIGESDEDKDEDVEEGADMDKIPAFVRKQKQQSQDAAQTATDKRNEKSGAQVWSSKRANESVDSVDDILKLAGLKK